jgi:hypothetical protein
MQTALSAHQLFAKGLHLRTLGTDHRVNFQVASDEGGINRTVLWLADGWDWERRSSSLPADSPSYTKEPLLRGHPER